MLLKGENSRKQKLPQLLVAKISWKNCLVHSCTLLYTCTHGQIFINHFTADHYMTQEDEVKKGVYLDRGKMSLSDAAVCSQL